MAIPKILHYCFGMADDFGGKPWSLAHYVCLRSAIEHIKPDAVYFYYAHEPQTQWWKLTEPLVTKIKIEAPQEIFGRPLLNPAHRADIVRLIALLERGGIYLDADVMVHRSFDSLLNHAAVLGQEGLEGQYGVANAVILAQPHSLFITRWFDQYKWFRGGKSLHDPFWSEHSVQLPSFMYRLFPTEVTVLDHDAFYWPLWTDSHIEWIFNSNTPIDISKSFATHLWESLSWQWLKNLTPGHVRGLDTNFARWAKPYVSHLPDDFGMAGASSATSEHQSRQAAFQQTYAKGLWGTDGQTRFFSGIGSRGSVAETYIKAIVAELDVLRAQLRRPLTIVDVGCGDFAIGAEIARQTRDIYIGCDIVPELVDYNITQYASERVSFRILDAVMDPLPDADVYLVRQVLQHLPNADIQQIIQKLRPHPFVYITEGQPRHAAGPLNPDKPADHEVRFDWRNGTGRGVELNHAPYNLNLEFICRAELPTETIETYQIRW
ncbi:glycosyltransferase [Methylobacterium sp. E-066]|uniref:glycosyltransferase n=1 Tax=Methylobacterium sp. E-066 TaxID=2836584 RepID=UPI001FB895C2|nr:glycosyltransferase [Methylobacterium sp. E-066]MCJ2140350.1 methyltransferase domain-containing protein [Methylobacterium sp. E-066]